MMKDIEEKKVWDIGVRIFHWSLVALVFIALLSGEDAGPLHVRVGLLIIALVGLRIIWGFIGTKHARFTDFVRGPSEVRAYLTTFLSKRHKLYSGHNPAGGAMIVALILVLAFMGFTGLKTVGYGQGIGYFSAGELSRIIDGHETKNIVDNDKDEYIKYDQRLTDEDLDSERGTASYALNTRASADNEQWEEVHEVLGGILIFMIILHVLAVLLTWYLHGENLIKSMITGRKQGSVH